MRAYHINKKFQIDICDYILVVFLILNFQSVYQNTYSINYHIYELTAFAIILSMAVCLFTNKITRKKLESWLGITAMFYLYIGMFMVVSVDGKYIFNFISRYGMVPFILLYFFCKSSEEVFLFILKFIKTVVLISLVSLFFWIFGSVLKFVQPSGTISIKWGSSVSSIKNYYYLYFETQYVDWLPIVLKRNSSIFVEGPMFVGLLSITYLFLICFEENIKKAKKYKLLIFLTILTTFSVNGIVFIIIVEGLNKELFKINKRNFFVLPIIISAIYVLIINKSGSSSFGYRVDDIYVGIKSWLQAPIFGKGFGDMTVITENMVGRTMTGYSISLLALLAQGGIWLTTLYVLPIVIVFITGIKRSKKDCIILSFGYFYLLSTIIFYTCFINFYIWFILFTLYFKYKKRYAHIKSYNKYYNVKTVL